MKVLQAVSLKQCQRAPTDSSFQHIDTVLRNVLTDHAKKLANISKTNQVSLLILLQPHLDSSIYLLL